MLCESCHKVEALVHITKVIDPEGTTPSEQTCHYCERCADQVLRMGDQLSPPSTESTAPTIQVKARLVSRSRDLMVVRVLEMDSEAVSEEWRIPTSEVPQLSWMSQMYLEGMKQAIGREFTIFLTPEDARFLRLWTF